MLSESEFGGKYDQLRTVSSEHAIPSVATRPIAQILVAPADQFVALLWLRGLCLGQGSNNSHTDISQPARNHFTNTSPPNISE